MPMFKFITDYEHEQTVIGSGTIWGEVEADSQEEAEKIIEEMIKHPSGSESNWYDYEENDCEVVDADEIAISGPISFTLLEEDEEDS